MVQAAEYIHGKLIQENLLERAFNWRKERVMIIIMTVRMMVMMTMMLVTMVMVMILLMAMINLFFKCNNQGTDKFALVCVGHSLGGGTAAILAIILRS